MLPPVFGVLFDGFAYGMLLFLLSVGLSVTLGHDEFRQPGPLRLRHARWLRRRDAGERPGWPFLATLPIAFLAAAVAASSWSGCSTAASTGRASSTRSCSRSASRSCQSRPPPTSSGPMQQPIQTPSFLRGSFHFLGLDLGAYRLFLIGVGAAGGAAAGGDARIHPLRRPGARRGRQPAHGGGLGINVEAAFAITFALGSGLAGLGGALAIEIVGLDLWFAFAYLVYVLIVVSVGGLGSIGGSFAAAACSASATSSASTTSPSSAPSSSTSSWWCS